MNQNQKIQTKIKMHLQGFLKIYLDSAQYRRTKMINKNPNRKNKIYKLYKVQTKCKKKINQKMQLNKEDKKDKIQNKKLK